MSRLKQDTSIGTTRFRQAVYLNWTRRMLIPDPTGNDRGYTFIIACFIEQLVHDHNSQSTTVCGYVQSMNILFQLRNCTIPADLSDKRKRLYILKQENKKKILRDSAVPSPTRYSHTFSIMRETELRKTRSKLS